MSLAKCSSVPNGVHVGGLLAHRDLAPPTRDRVDAARRALVREADAREQLVAGVDVAHRRESARYGLQSRQLTETLQSKRPRCRAARP